MRATSGHGSTQGGLLDGDEDVGVLLAAGMDSDLHVLTNHVSPGPHRRAGSQGTDVTAGIAAGDDGEQLIGGPQRRGHGASHGLGVGLGTIEGDGAQPRSGAPGAAGQLSQLRLLTPAGQGHRGGQDPGLVISVAHEELNTLGLIAL